MMQSVIIAEDAQIISNLLELHRAGPNVLDLTFGHGRFWSKLPNTDNNRAITAIDTRHPKNLDPPRTKPAHQLQASLTALPFKPGKFDAAVCDPPFLIVSGQKGRIGRRYTSPPTYHQLLNLMETCATEAHKALKPKAIVIIKAMDTTEGRRRRWFHSDVQRLWEERGWRQDDLIVKIGVTNMRNPDWKYQARSKSAHTYFLVFRKTKP